MSQPLFIFDLDGTLEDSRTDMALSVNRVRRIYGLPELPEELVRTLVIRGMDFLYRSCFPELCKEGEPVPEALVKKYELNYASHIVDHTVLYEGMAATLPELARHGKLFVYTNKPEGLSRLLLEKLNILSCFTEIIGSDSHKKHKPDPEPVLDAIAKHGLKPSEIFMIGDSQADMQAAENLQATAVWCKWGYQKEPPEQPSPHTIARHPSDLQYILLP
jgi:phosphoglycolate phosphatase